MDKVKAAVRGSSGSSKPDRSSELGRIGEAVGGASDVIDVTHQELLDNRGRSKKDIKKVIDSESSESSESKYKHLLEKMKKMGSFGSGSGDHSKALQPDSSDTLAIEERSEQAKQTDRSTLTERVALLKADMPPFEKLQQFIKIYPEMKQLIQAVDETPEKHATITKKTFGEQLFGLPKKAVIEFNRTAVAMLSLEQVVNNRYGDFTACQKESERLTPESFGKIREHTLHTLGSPEALDAMDAYLSFNDLGKVSGVREEIEEKYGKHDDHDAVLATILKKHPDRVPSFQRLSPNYQDMILKSLDANFNLGQFVQAECPPASLEGVLHIKPETRSFLVIESRCDISGAIGQFVQNGSAIMTEPYFQAFQAAKESLEEAKPGDKPEQVYKNCLGKRAKLLGMPFENDQDYAAVRLACKLRATPADAGLVTAALEFLPEEPKNVLTKEALKKGTDDGKALLLTYEPAFLNNARKAVEPLLKEQGEENPSVKAMAYALRDLAKIYQEVRSTVPNSSENGVYTFDISARAREASEIKTLEETWW